MLWWSKYSSVVCVLEGNSKLLRPRRPPPGVISTPMYGMIDVILNGNLM